MKAFTSPKKQWPLLWLTLGLGILLSSQLHAQANIERGLEIFREGDRRDSGFVDSSVELTMILTNAKGAAVRREMRQKILEVDGDGDKSIMVFDRPRDLKGTAILTFTHKVGTDDQWLFLPALKRVKRISSADKSGPFMGSEFAYEDLASQEVEKYTYRYLQDEILEGELCFVVERVPVDKKSGYTRQLTWIDQGEYRMQRIDYYDRKNELLKTMLLKDYQQYLGQYWRPGELLMSNHQSGKSTSMQFNNYQFRLELRDREFTRDGLSRVK